MTEGAFRNPSTLPIAPRTEEHAPTPWQWFRRRRATARARYAPVDPPPDDAEKHIGTYGQIWFQHAYSVEARGPHGPWRATCKCGYRGDWWPWKITAEIDSEYHPMIADWAWDKV